MAFDLKQNLKLTQKLMMTPQLQQAIKLLKLSRVELEEFVSQQLSENPFLEEGIKQSAEEKSLSSKETESTASDVNDQRMQEATDLVDKREDGSKQDIDWEAYSKHKEQETPIPSSYAKNAEDFPNYENIVTKQGDLRDFLNDQISESDLDETEIQIAKTIIGNIDDRGYLQSSVEEMAEQLSKSVDNVEDILDVVQRLEPSGVGARDLSECLLIQLRETKQKNGVVEVIVKDHMHDLETRNYQNLAKKLNISLDEVIANVQIIADLEPVPGRQFGPISAEYIAADVYVFKLGDDWIVGLNEEGLPKLQISELYDSVNNDKVNQKDKEFIQEKLKSAEWLIKSIQERQKTIFRVTEAIVEKQRDFFEEGVEHLKPMILKDIAEELELHQSTISRVTANKFVQTPRGIFELKYFFNSSVTKSDGSNLASESVKSFITALIKQENPKKPYSDQKIVELLEEKHDIRLARRTVAKYREQLMILPSSKRKKHF